MAKRPARQKVTVLFYRRSGPDEVLVVEHQARGAMRWGLPSDELGDGETPRAAALRLVPKFVSGAPLGDMDLGEGATYRVNAGPSAGEWTERFYAVELPTDRRALQGRWAIHYDAKAAAGADAPRVREAFTRLREAARLKP